MQYPSISSSHSYSLSAYHTRYHTWSQPKYHTCTSTRVVVSPYLHPVRPRASQAMDPKQMSGKEYAERYKLEELLSAAVNAAVSAREPDPAMAIARYLLQGRSMTEAHPTEFQGRQLAPAERFRHPSQ